MVVRGGRGCQDGPIGDDALPLYVADDGPLAGRRSPPHGVGASPPRAPSDLARAARFARGLADELAERRPATPPPIGAVQSDLRQRTNGYVITRYLIAYPSDVLPAFDAWRESAGSDVTSPDGTLRFTRRSVEVQPHQLRVVAGALRLPASAIRVPVNLELVPWGTYRTVLHLNLARRLVRTLGWHRRGGYFSAGHAVLEEIRAAVETHLEA